MRASFSCETRAYTPLCPPPLTLSQWEQTIFRFLRRSAEHTTPPAELRIAGGWVRDKLLQRDTADIDVAVRFTTGVCFAHHIHRVATSPLQKPAFPTCTEYVPAVSSITGIKPNPEMSRHLETAAVCLDGADLDLVHLRTDDYADENRIPTVRHGTPRQDAHRRDFTINSLFYNLHNGSIEDHTNRGIADLNARLLRTPLDPTTTLLDDPLRALRAIRFACTLDFRMCPTLCNALQAPQLAAVLQRKVSRERIGNEVMLITTSNDPNRGLRMIGDYNLCGSVFGVDFSGEKGGCSYREGVARVRDVLGLMEKFEEVLPHADVQKFALHGRVVLILASLLGETDRIPGTLGEALRRERRLQQDVKRVVMQSERLERFVREWRRVGGRRNMKEREEALWVRIAEAVREAGHDLWIAVAALCAQRIGGSKLLVDLMRSGISSELCNLSYAATGDRLQAELGIRAGPEVGEALKDLMRVQLRQFRQQTRDTSSAGLYGEPSISADYCVERLKAKRVLVRKLVRS